MVRGDFSFLMHVDPATVPCRSEDQDPEMWFAEGLHLRALEDIEQAKELCRGCPVKDQCLEDAMAREDGLRQPQRHGIYGALDPYDRAELAGFRVCRPKPKRTPAECGTPAGYSQHRRRRETPCRPCCDAINATRPRTTTTEGTHQ